MARHRIMWAKDPNTDIRLPTLNLATSYFPEWVVERAPNLAEPNVSGLPTWFREAFGDTSWEDLIENAPRLGGRGAFVVPLRAD